jgi:hypothetical protein
MLSCLMSLNGWSTTLTKARSTYEGSSVQKFKFEKNTVIFDKQSNFFDAKKDLRIGIFHTTAAKAEVSAVKQKLEAMAAKISLADQVLKNKNSSFNELSGPVKHESFYLLNDYLVTNESNLYSELETLFVALQGLEWKQQEGYFLSPDYKQVSVVKNGKVQVTEDFNFEFHCNKPAAPTTCGYKKWGILVLQ